LPILQKIVFIDTSKAFMDEELSFTETKEKLDAGGAELRARNWKTEHLLTKGLYLSIKDRNLAIWKQISLCQAKAGKEFS